jgi:hypothetical protein
MANRVNFTLPTNIGNVVDPVNAQDAATKNYVDNRPAGGGDKSYSIRVGAVYQALDSTNTSVAYPAGSEASLITPGLTATFGGTQSDGMFVGTGGLTVTGVDLPVGLPLIIAATDGSWNVTQAYVVSKTGSGSSAVLTINQTAVFNSNASLTSPLNNISVEVAQLLKNAVTGPQSPTVTDNALARFDGTSGDAIQASQVIVSDTGGLTGISTLEATTSLKSPAVVAESSAGLALQNTGGTTQLSVGAGGGNNVSISVATNINPANAAVSIQPTGTGSVTIKPSTAGAMDNMVIGSSTAAAATVTTLTANTVNSTIVQAVNTSGITFRNSAGLEQMVIGAGGATPGDNISFNAPTYLGDDLYPVAGSTTMVDGFVFIPAAAGGPTVNPQSTNTGSSPLYLDKTVGDEQLYTFVNGVWKVIGGGTPGADVWSIGYENVTETRAVLGASNKATILGGNGVDGISIGDTTTETVTACTGLPLTAQPVYYGVGRYLTNTYVLGNDKGVRVAPSTTGVFTAFTGALANCSAMQVNGLGTMAQINDAPSAGSYIFSVGPVGGTQATSATTAVYGSVGETIGLFDISVKEDNTAVVAVGGRQSRKEDLVRYPASISGATLTVNGLQTSAKFAPRAPYDWQSASCSSGDIVFAIDNAGDLYRIDFAPTTPTSTRVAQGFVSNSGVNSDIPVNANANYVVGAGEDGGVSLYVISTGAVSKFNPLDNLVNVYGVAVDTLGNISLVGSNSAGTTVYLASPALTVINKLLVPTQPTTLLDSSGVAIGTNQLFVASPTGLIAIPNGTAGQLLKSNGVNAPSWSAGGQFKGAYTSSAQVNASTDTLLTWPQVTNTLSSLAYSNGIFTANRVCVVTFSMNIVFTGLTGCTEADIYFTQNGAAGTRAGQAAMTNTTALTPNLLLNSSWTFKLNAGDSIRSYVWANGSTGYNVGNSGFGNNSRIEVVELS